MSSVEPPSRESLQLLTEIGCRHIPSFFLGGLFLSALTTMVSPTFLSHFLSSLKEDTPEDFSRSIYTRSTSSSVVTTESRTLIFLLSFGFASASISLFASLPTFPIDARTACAFVIAWGGFATQAACFIGLFILFLELRRLGIKRWEIFMFLVWLVLAAASVIVTNTLSPGLLDSKGLPRGLDVAFCVKRRNFWASVASSLAYILLELYTLCRFWSLLAPPFLLPRHRLKTLTDARILRTMALLLLELLVIYPWAMETNVLVEFLPYSFGGLLVLAAFSMPVRTLKEAKTISIPPSSRYTSMMLPTADTPLSASQWRDSKPSSLYDIRQSTPSMPQSDMRHSELSSLPELHHHPFSARSLSDPTTFLGKEWPPPSRTARSSRSIDTTAARSIRTAIVQTAKRAVHSFEPRQVGSTLVLSDSATGTTGPTSPSFIETASYQTSIQPPPSVARPRLVVFTKNQEPRGRPDNAVTQPTTNERSVLRLTPTSASTEQLSNTGLQFPRSPATPASSVLKQLPQLPPQVSSSRESDSGGSSLSYPITFSEERSGETSGEGGQRESSSSYTFGYPRLSNGTAQLHGSANPPVGKTARTDI